ncbi:unnamed protein product, partial [Ilex paraguariensis]
KPLTELVDLLGELGAIGLARIVVGRAKGFVGRASKASKIELTTPPIGFLTISWSERVLVLLEVNSYLPY